jgi:anti-sigma B factor antagonist
MTQPKIQIGVRSPSEGIGILDMQGPITRSAEEALLEAYGATESDARAILLNLSEVQSISSHGAGLLIQLLARGRKKGQRLLASGLNDSSQRAFEVTRLDEAIGIYPDETRALASLGSHRDSQTDGGIHG